MAEPQLMQIRISEEGMGKTVIVSAMRDAPVFVIKSLAQNAGLFDCVSPASWILLGESGKEFSPEQLSRVPSRSLTARLLPEDMADVLGSIDRTPFKSFTLPATITDVVLCDTSFVCDAQEPEYKVSLLSCDAAFFYTFTTSALSTVKHLQQLVPLFYMAVYAGKRNMKLQVDYLLTLEEWKAYCHTQNVGKDDYDSDVNDI
eukprot:m51a1_g5051 hypothetical protein (202) ;mRNA; r:65036-66040